MTFELSLGRVCDFLISQHKQATTTPIIKVTIQASADPAWMVAKSYRMSAPTVWKWRKWIGEEGVKSFLTTTIEADRQARMISERSVGLVIVDATVMEKAIAHLRDAQLCERGRKRLGAPAQKAYLPLRHRYARLAPHLSGQVGRCAHAQHFGRMRMALRRPKGYIGRVIPDIHRLLGWMTDGSVRHRIEVEIALVDLFLLGATDAERQGQALCAARARS